MAAVLALTMTACGGGGNTSDPGSGGGSGSGSGTGTEAVSSADCVYSTESIILEDEDGYLEDLSIDNLAYRDGRIYGTGFVYGSDADMGSHVLLNFGADGSDLQYTTLMSGGMEDVIAMNIGMDGNYYVVRLTYDSAAMGFAGAGSTAEEHAAVEEEFTEEIEGEPETEGEDSMVGPDGAVQGEEESAFTGPTEEYSEEAEPDHEIENMEEFFTEDGGESPDGEEFPTEEADEGITSPQDEFEDEISQADAEDELFVTDVEEGADATMGDGEAAYVLSCFSPAGDEIWSASAQMPKSDAIDYYINAIACCEEGVLVSGSSGLELYSKEDGSFIKTLNSDNEIMGATPYVLEDGTVVVFIFGGSGEEVCTVDLQTGQLGEHYTIPSEAGMSSIFPGKSYALYLAGSSAVYGMNLDGSGVVKVIDYVDSDMDITALTGLAEMEDGRFAAVVSDISGTNMIEILTKVDPETVANRKLLTLGSYYLDYEVRKQVFAFNKQSQDVRISIVDYSQYDGDTGTEGMAKLNTDIASGSAPDILILSGAMPIKSYISKGVFEDLAPYLESDEEISGKEYLSNVINAFKTDDKLYAIVPSFYVNAIVGKTEDIGDGSGFTLDFADELAKKKGTDPARMFGITTRDDMLYQAMELCGDQFIDWENSTCSFDSPEFIRLLEFLNQFPAKVETDFEEDTSADYRSGKSLFYRESIGTFDEYVNTKYGIFGTDITMAGFPSQKPGKAVIFPQLEIAVNASSQEKDACWSFVRRFLLDDYQNSLEMYWPVSINALDQMANKAMEPLYYEDEFGNQVEDHIIVNIGGEDIELPRISDTEVDQMYAFLKGLDSEAYYDSSVENIIAEESAAFFEGQKSAEDVAGVIQSRIQIYINENS